MTDTTVMLTVVTALVVIATTKANIQDSSGACNVDKYSLSYVKDHMCDGNSREIISVTYASTCKCGELLTKDETKSQPTMKWISAKEDEIYTIVMADPDAPKKGTDTLFYVHWIRVGVTGGALKDGNIDGKDLHTFSYAGPTPPSGTHRYQFYIFVSTGRDVKSSQQSRASFSLVEFAEENDLCRCVGRFQFRVEHKD